MTNKIGGLSISGYGRLEHIMEYSDSSFVIIHCLPTARMINERGELLILNCVVTDEAIRDQLKQYQCAIKQKRTVMIKFAVKYLEMAAYYNGMTPNDPERIVHLSARLETISEIFVTDVKSNHKEIAKR